MRLKGTAFEGMDWIDLAQDRVTWQALVNTVIKLRVPFWPAVWLFLEDSAMYCRTILYFKMAQCHKPYASSWEPQIFRKSTKHAGKRTCNYLH